MHFKFSYICSFLIHLELKHTLLLFPWKPCPIPGQSWQNLNPFSDWKGAKTLHSGMAHTHMTYVREYTPPPPPSGREPTKEKMIWTGALTTTILDPFSLCIGQFQVCPFPPPPPSNRGAFPHLLSPVAGHYQILHGPGIGHLSTWATPELWFARTLLSKHN